MTLIELYQDLQVYQNTNNYLFSSLAISKLLTYLPTLGWMEDSTCKSTKSFTIYTRPEWLGLDLIQSGTALFGFMQLSVNAVLRKTYTENVLQHCMFDWTT